MVHDICIVHCVLLPGIPANIVKNQHGISEQILPENKQATEKQSCQKQQPCL